jgi:hypothetical protein
VELGELVAVAIPDIPVEDECPFSHEKPNPTEKNELGGVGTTLGNNLAGGTGVHKSKPPTGGDFTKCSADPDPRDATPKLTFVTIKVSGQAVTLDDEVLPYPLTCAAHHLIPAQESLKGNPILKYMCKDGESQDFRSSGGPEPAAVSGSKVWGNVAYNVNGGQNGVWLPGNYAVGAGVGGVEVWKSKASDKRSTYSNTEAAENWIKALDLGPDEWKQFATDPVEKEGPQPGALAKSLATAALPKYMLSGTNYHIDDGNPKWAYVKAAMSAAGGLFHDRHKPYSDEVATYLKKIAESYATMYERSTDLKKPCKKCEDAQRPDGAKDTLVGPPYGIVGRLIAGANFFKQYVKTKSVTAKNIYTSTWVSAWTKTKP